MFLYDVLPYHSESEGYDWLVGLKSGEFDYRYALPEHENDKMEYLKTLSQPAFGITTDSDDPAVQEVVGNAAASLGHPVTGLGEDYRLYGADDTLRGQLAIANAGGTEYEGRRITPVSFGIWLGDLPDTLNGKDGYTITVTYTTQVDPKLVSELDGRAYGYNYVALRQRDGDRDVFLSDADSGHWVDHSTARNVLAKSVAAFDSETDIVTYRVNINPDASLMAAPGAAYILEDVLDLPGAVFIEDSFQLSFQGTVVKAGNSYPFTWDPGKELLCWHAGWNGEDWVKYYESNKDSLDIAPDVMREFVNYMGYEGSDDPKAVNIQVNNPADASSNFTFTLTNRDNILALAAPEEAGGRLAPMVLTYQVKLPEAQTVPAQETITNSATLSQKAGDNETILLGGVKTAFDYTTALHKRLSAAPNGDNGYTAAFEIHVDKGVEEWKNTGDTFTVSDEMSKTLAVDITSIKVYGIKADGTEDLLDSGYTTAYDDRSSGTQNFLFVTITDREDCARYRIEYSTKVQGEVGGTVAYDNVAGVAGTEIKNDIYIQKQDGSVITID